MYITRSEPYKAGFPKDSFKNLFLLYHNLKTTTCINGSLNFKRFKDHHISSSHVSKQFNPFRTHNFVSLRCLLNPLMLMMVKGLSFYEFQNVSAQSPSSVKKYTIPEMLKKQRTLWKAMHKNSEDHIPDFLSPILILVCKQRPLTQQKWRQKSLLLT